MITGFNIKPLDFVRTPKGAIAIVTETKNRSSACIAFLGGGNPTNERNAWWDAEDGLVIVDSLPHLLAVCTSHPFGGGKDDANDVFPLPIASHE